MKRLAIALALSLPAYAATFAHDIAPIVYQNCAPCHRPGEAGPFSLLTYKDVKSHARQIADVTRRRYMPPWAPEAGFGKFADERHLTDAQIRTIAEWVAEVMDQPLWQRLRDESIAVPGRMRIHMAEHRMIYEAVAGGDARAAEFYARAHIERVRRYMTLD